MQEFKGTPGPWKVNVIGQHWNNPSQTHIEVTFGDDGECVCDTVYQRDDANLIAVGPEMLSVLNRLEVAVNTLSYCYRNRPENFASALEIAESESVNARSIIAKALGGE